MYSVSSTYAADIIGTSLPMARQFLIGTSDYSAYVMRWPSISKKWDALAPQTVVIDLSNAGKSFNFLGVDPTLMRNVATVKLGISYSGTPPKSMTGLVNSGTAQAAASASLTLAASAVTSDDYYVPMEVRIVGGAGAAQRRPVLSSRKNRLNYSSDPSNAIWTKQAGCTVTLISDDEWEIDVTACAVNQGFYHAAAASIGVNGYYCNAVDLKIGTSNGTNIVQMNEPTGIDGTLPLLNVTLTTAWQRASIAGRNAATDRARGLWIRKVSGGINIFRMRRSQQELGQVATEYTRTEALAAVGVAVAPWDVMPDATSTYEIIDSDLMSVFAGTIDAVRYADASCSMTLIDKFRKLSDRKVGDTTSPVNYTSSSYLVHDMAWYACTSLGGLSAITSTSNPDIDYASFGSWSSIFSVDNTRVKGQFVGQQPIEVLKKLSLLTQSAIFIENDKLKFARYTLAGAPTNSLTNVNVKDAVATLDDRTLVNKAWVSGAYDVNSKTFGLTVFDQSSSSQVSYGLRESLSAETFIWLVDSTSALNLAQRSIFTNAAIRRKYKVTTTLHALLSTIGDTVVFTDPLLEDSDTYRVMGESLDTDTGIKTFDIDQSQYFGGFTLDVSALDSSDILT